MTYIQDLSSETALQDALKEVIGADTALKTLIGDPVRLVDVAAARPGFPFIEIARHQTTNRSGALVEAHEHVIDLRVLTRWNGRGEARAILGEMRRVIDLAQWPDDQWRVIYCHAVYSDVLALRDGRSYRGLMRLRAMTQRAETASES